MRLDPDRLFAPLDLSNRRTVLVAVSGGSDSTALLHLFKSFADRHDLRIVAATVDHGLRAASADEARHVAADCASLGIAHVILRWTGDKPSTGIQAAARHARYKLLAKAAREAGTDLVLLGHTTDDQRETVAMRQARGTVSPDRRGDAGMARATLYEDRTWFARPLLDISRADLRTYLSDQNIGWIDDPSNLDRTYERVRVRQDSPVARPDATHRLTDNAHAARWLSTVEQPSPGLFRLDPEYLTAPDTVTALRMLLAIIGGTDHLPDRDRTEALAARLAAPSLRATLSRTVIDRRRNAIWLYRENRALPAPMPAEAGAFWDGRYLLAADRGTVAPLGAAADQIDIAVPADASRALVRAALAAGPALWDGAHFVRPLAPDEARPVLEIGRAHV